MEPNEAKSVQANECRDNPGRSPSLPATGVGQFSTKMHSQAFAWHAKAMSAAHGYTSY